MAVVRVSIVATGYSGHGIVVARESPSYTPRNLTSRMVFALRDPNPTVGVHLAVGAVSPGCRPAPVQPGVPALWSSWLSWVLNVLDHGVKGLNNGRVLVRAGY